MIIAKEKPKSTYYEEQVLKKGLIPGQKSYDLPRPREKRIPVPRESLLVCGLLLCLILIGAGLITQYGRIIAGSYHIQEMRNEIGQFQEENEHLLLEVRRLSSLDRIEAIAVNELGLQYPENRQWLILSAGN